MTVSLESARCVDIRVLIALCRIAQRPGRACLYLLTRHRPRSAARCSASIEPDADWFDGVWWAIVTLTTVGYGDYSPESFLGRWLGAFVMAGGIGAVAILTGLLADEIREARIHDRDETPELDDDIEHVMAMIEDEIEQAPRTRSRTPRSSPRCARSTPNEEEEEAL